MRALTTTICMASMLSLWSGAFAAATDFNAVVRDAVAERTAPAAPAPQQQAKPQPPAEVAVRAADIAGQLDILLLKAAKTVSVGTDAKVVETAAKAAGLPKATVKQLLAPRWKP